MVKGDVIEAMAFGFPVWPSPVASAELLEYRDWVGVTGALYQHICNGLHLTHPISAFKLHSEHHMKLTAMLGRVRLVRF